MAVKVTFFTYAYPPIKAPRSIQIARMVKFSRHSIQVIGCDDDKPKDETIPCTMNGKPEKLVRFRRDRHSWLYPWNLAANPPIPDHYREWALRAARESLRDRVFAGQDVLVTFGQPMSDHLAGLRIKRETGLPWIAHFSDPWADSPYRGNWPFVPWLNRSLERNVVEKADCVIFTSQETVDLVMRKYPSEWRSKAEVLPHAFDPDLYMSSMEKTDQKIVIRHVGNFYKPRTPDVLIEALLFLRRMNPTMLDNIKVELIGRVESHFDLARIADEFPIGMFEIRQPVNYVQSLRLMRSADLLLVMDAPFDQNVFLPSKLIDYIGAARPILAFSPPGTSANLVSRLGGWVANPSDKCEVAYSLVEALESLEAFDRGKDWGNPEVRREYSATAVIDKFDALVERLVQP